MTDKLNKDIIDAVKGCMQSAHSDGKYGMEESAATGLLFQMLMEKLQSLPMVSGEPIEYLLGGMRVKLNFNKMGNMTSLANMEHDLQGRWVSFVGAENDKHLRATSPQPLQPITADDVTDEMHETFNATHMPFGPDREIMAAAYNAVIKHRSEAK